MHACHHHCMSTEDELHQQVRYAANKAIVLARQLKDTQHELDNMKRIEASVKLKESV